ncbi:hypothetical protein LINPERHAP2_LOCUS42391 [Linum perenne]
MHYRTCKGRGHNARKCPNKDTIPATENVPAPENVPAANQRPGGVVDPNTNRTRLNNELRTAMQGVGVYTIPTTGNMYYRVPPGGLDARVVDDVHVGSQPPAT